MQAYLTLEGQIHNFVDAFDVVEERQIIEFFKDAGRREVAYILKRLLNRSYLHRVEGTTRITTVRRLPKNNNSYDDVIDALDVMIQLPFQAVDWYCQRDYPYELEFCTDNRTTHYDVAVFNQYNWVAKYDVTKRVKGKNLPAEEPDPTKHIAVVSNEELIEKLEPLDYFMFVKITDRKTGELEKWTYE